ncbi:MAG: gamma-butyrobetaine dioxygenase, partial [Silicimonas sp.]|nr:gamma-butyrobetaine dioxygenase [Silicimonas sp.]
ARVGAGGVEVAFSDGHRTHLPADWLRDNRYDGAGEAGVWSPAVRLWRAGHAVAGDELPRLQSSPAALRDWLAAIVRDGVARVSGVPTASGSLEEIVKLFGHVRETNYGRWFDVRSEVNPTNLAYTNLGLQAHTDNPYRDPVPGLQVLACLENSVDGGESSVVDGFAAIEMLRSEDRQAFDVLADYPARFEYAGSDGVRLRSKRPIIECGPDGQVIAVRFNNRSLAAVTDIPFDNMEVWYAALRRLAEIIDDDEGTVTFRLTPGEAFIVDNTRVLHARKAFSSSGSRWLQGCYADLDGLRSTLASLEAA